MLWQRNYETRIILGPLPLPRKVKESVLIGGFDDPAFAEIALWRKLCLADLPDQPRRILLLGPPEAWQSADDLFPPSVQRETERDQLHLNEWTELIQPDRPERSFAARITDGQATILMIGPPTEEAWDRFVSGC